MSEFEAILKILTCGAWATALGFMARTYQLHREIAKKSRELRERMEEEMESWLP